ncbi:sterol desaturase family protein [Actinocorallia sp. A-T 12471]|uniref:sterol desaturase family protein n=1 Tax=Actinocorallia sp. A-T 12471 TaxID=3089813 RepID=UPI0029D011AC|nr:sterol desaturase family protein [Actinocorallia sp. A-T 12471]MDX6744031.1 sterol desaturase family protein [Actinocorallia sp. A-T 12471]
MPSAIWDQINTPLLYAIPVFVVSIAVEALALRDRDRAETTGYLVKDARTSISMGAGSLVSSLVLKLTSLVLYVYLWTYLAPWHIPTDTWWSWALLLLAVDLAWYVNHRFSHRVRIGWAAHQAHHSSEYFNFGTALRQKWNPWSEALFWIPLPLLGFAPWTIYVAFMINLIYQFFTHTETVGKLPRPVEYVFNTPSHHRVHHGSDPEYLDKNYGGILIIWDRMFGTFQEELHRPKYGLTKPVGTYNLLKLQYHEYGNIIRDVRGARGLRAKLGYVFAPPGWTPEDAPAPVPSPR